MAVLSRECNQRIELLEVILLMMATKDKNQNVIGDVAIYLIVPLITTLNQF